MSKVVNSDNQGKSNSGTVSNMRKMNTILKKTVIAVTVITVVIMISFFVINSINNIETRDKGSVTKSKKSGISSTDTYYTPTPVWGTSSSVAYEYQVGDNKYPINETAKCQVYTYENLAGENEFSSTLDVVSQARPNINTVFDDYVNGLNHIGGINPCISEDQIYAVNVGKTCSNDNSSHNKCYNNYGKVIPKGESISYPGRCTQLKTCEGRLGSLSLNFKVENNRINGKTMCIGVSQIQVPTQIYNAPNDSFPDIDLSYYIEDGIVVENSSLGVCDSYYPVTLRNEICNTRSARQKFLVTNYKFGPQQQKEGENSSEQENTFVPDSEGIYTSIIYKPLNAYLDMEFSDSGGIAEIKLTSPGTCYQANTKYNVIPFGSGALEWELQNIGSDANEKDKKKVAQVLISGLSGSNNEVGSFIISDTGAGYTKGTCVYFSDIGPSSYGTSATGIITSIYETNPKIVLRKIPSPSEFQDIKWIFMPSLDLSSQRFPTQQRCNFIQQAETSKNEYSLLTIPLEKNTVFIESQFEGNNNFEMKSDYCTGIVTQYPAITFQNLTQFGTLNPFSFYNYSVKSTKGHSPSQGEPHPFKLERNGTLRNFTTGETFQDGNSTILVTDFSKNILQFPANYFINTTGSVLSYFPVPPGTVENSSPNDIYKLSDSGLIKQIKVNNNGSLGTSRVVITGSYSNVSPIKAETSSGESSSGTSASFDIQVTASVDLLHGKDTPNIIISSISNQGINYNVGDILTINSSDIGLSGFSNPSLEVEETELEKFIFTSIPMRIQSGNPLILELESNPFENTSTEYPIRDFTVIGTLTTSQESPNTLNFEVYNDIVMDRGTGMVENYNMLMLQLDLKTSGIIDTTRFNNLVTYLRAKNFLNLSNDSSSYKKLIWINPTEVQTNQYGGDIPAPVSLVDDPGTGYYQFNFLSGSKMVLNPSPQQIVYAGEVVFQNLTLIEEFILLKINRVDEITKYFFSQKSGIDTNVTYLKSLQYDKLKYSTTEDNNISEGDKIVLGRFIPYTSFTPMKRKKISRLDKFKATFENLSSNRTYKINLNVDSQLPTEPDNTVYNDNYAQLIPYGLDSVYKTNVKYSKEAGSSNPYNNIVTF